MEKESKNLGLAFYNALIESDLISDIPGIGHVYKAGKAAITMRDELLRRKIEVFLDGVSEIPLNEHVKFLSQFESNEDRSRFGESLLMLIDSLYQMEKVKLIDRLYRALAFGKINKQDFSILCESVNKVFIADLPILEKIYKTGKDAKNEADMMAYSRLFNAGLLHDAPSRYDLVWSHGKPIAEENINKYGKLLVEIALQSNEETK